MAFEDYSSAGLQALQGGVQLGVGLRQAKIAEAEQQQEAAKLQRQQQFVTDLQSATQSGDSRGMLDLMSAYPDQADTITKMIGAKDAQHAKAIGNFAGQLGSMIDAGDMNGAMGLVAQNADIITAQGRDPLQFIQQIKENPALVKQGADAMMLMTMTPEEQLTYRNKLEDLELRRQGQEIQVRGQNMTASTAAADRAQRAQANAENLQLKLAELGAKPSLDVKDIKSINSDLTALKKDSDVMYSAANDLQTIRDNATPAAQLAAIFKFMKALDPTSVVREGEQVMLQKTGGLFDTMGNYVSQLNSGSRLNAKQLQDLTNTAKRLSNSTAGTVNTSIDDYLGTYGDTLSEGQRKLFQSRKLKMFDVPVASESEVAGTSRPNGAPPIQQPAGEPQTFTSSGGITFKVKG